MEINPLNHKVYQSVANSSSTSSGEQFATMFKANVLAQSGANRQTAESASSPTLDTNKGQRAIQLEEYFSTKQSSTNLLDVPLLLPTQHNVDTLAEYSEQQFKQLLADFNIPSPPKTIEFNSEGQLVLPPDYPHAAQLEQALQQKPEVEKALRTTAALASHYAGIMEAMDYQTEMLAAKNKAEEARITEKYQYLFDDNRAKTQIVLSFTGQGDMLIAGRNLAGTGEPGGSFWPVT